MSQTAPLGSETKATVGEHVQGCIVTIGSVIAAAGIGAHTSWPLGVGIVSLVWVIWGMVSYNIDQAKG